MADVLIEKPVCAECSAEVRNGSAFCYNCGKAVRPVSARSAGTESAPSKREGSKIPKSVPKPDVEAAIVSSNGRSRSNELENDIPIPKPLADKSHEPQKPLPIRGRSVSPARDQQAAEWVWKDASALRFLLVAAAAAVFVGLMLFLALYFR